MDKISRRQILGAAAAASVLSVSDTPAEAHVPRRRVRVKLSCAMKETTLDGMPVRLRAYNDQIPGPTITVRPGDTLHVRIKNGLPPYDSRGWAGNHNVPHDLGTTNLHVHGMDVIPHLFQPVGTSDPLAPMIAIKPGEIYDYTFELPKDHPPGLYWYHPHHHGSTAVQVVSGMAGPIIVRGDIDNVPAIKAARDIPLVIQDIGLFPDKDKSRPWSYEPPQNAIWQTFGGNVTIYDPKTGQAVPQNGLTCGFTTGDYPLRYFLLNGEPFFKEVHNSNNPQQPLPTQLKPPRFKIKPGEVVRFRLLNGCSDNYMPISLEGHPLYVLGFDGVNFNDVRIMPVSTSAADAQLFLAPANRAEFLVKGAAPGVYQMFQWEQNEQFLLSVRKTICEIEVVGDPVDMKLPTKLPVQKRYYPLIEPSEIKNVREVQFGGAFLGVLNPVVGVDFTINNMQYQDKAISTVVQLGDCEEWRLVVQGPHHGGTEGHPFHIHEVTFEVISINGVLQPIGTLKDTVWIAKDQIVIVRMRFLGWPGKTVFHCHILPHEDTGMMQNFLILPKRKAISHMHHM